MTDRAKTLRPIIQAALDEGGVDAVVEVVCAIIDEFEIRIADLKPASPNWNGSSTKTAPTAASRHPATA